MFLGERIFGITIYLTILLVVCYLIIRTKPKTTGQLLAFYLVCISLMAFFYVPAVEADLYRLTEHMLHYATLPAEDFTSILLESNTPVTLLYLRIIGFTGIVGLLAGLTALIVFGNIFYIIYDYSKRVKDSGKAAALSLFTIMSTGIYMQAISGIRNMLAFSILARCFYDEACNNKKVVMNAGWYIIACLIHPTAIAAVALRLAILLYNKVSTAQIRSLITTVFAFLIVGLSIIYFERGIYLESALDTFGAYTSEVVYTYFWDNIITALTIVLMFLHYRLYSHNRKEIGEDGLRWLVRLSIAFTLLSLAFFSEHSIFVRFTQLNLLIMIPVIISNVSTHNILTRARAPGSSVDIMQKLIFYIPLLIMIISASRGALSSLKFFAS